MKKDEVKQNPITNLLVKLNYNPALIDYLRSRKISIEIVRHYLKEVYRTVNGMNFFALGFENDKGAYKQKHE